MFFIKLIFEMYRIFCGNFYEKKKLSNFVTRVILSLEFLFFDTFAV